MGRLAGFRYREIVKRLKQSGFVFDRQAAGSHEIWYNPLTNRYTTLPNHPGELPEGTLRAVLKQAGIEVDDFSTGRPLRGRVSAFTSIEPTSYSRPLAGSGATNAFGLGGGSE